MNLHQAKQNYKKRNKTKITDQARQDETEGVSEVYQLTDWKANSAAHSQQTKVRFSPSQPDAGGSQTQPIPFLRAKASGSMFTAIMWSISIPDDSSVREVEQTVASQSHKHVHYQSSNLACQCIVQTTRYH